MTTDGIIRIKKCPKRGWGDWGATNAMREYVKEKLGKLDTATSFMYLFLRFGAPDYTTDDEPKVLYSYSWLRCDDLIFSIHASYHEFVYFSFCFPVEHGQGWWEQRQKTLKRILRESVKRGIPIQDFWHQKLLTKKDREKNGRIFNEYAKKHLPEGAYERLCEPCEKWSEADTKSYCDLQDTVHEDFLKSLKSNDREEFSKYEITLEDMPNVKAMLDKMIVELRTGYWVRDVPINILGYESKDNEIIFNNSDDDEAN
jgi:hypothetical protein